ncbi:MAG: type IX secretion system membrane protein PorP/SprF [Bacteroidales bacterium]|nr:type IX secretion system membrane protein PorP/SprF [Bacteroidales bacterium]
MSKRNCVRNLFFLLPLIWVTDSFGQQDPLFSQYAYNKMAFNPAYAGSAGRLSLDLITRIQWVGIQGAPETVSFNAHTPLRNPRIGIGLNVYRDKLGPTVDYGAMAAFAYRIIFPSTTLCFGVQAGFKYMDINWGLLDPKDQGDALLTGPVTNKAVPDVDFGMYYYGSRFYVGLSARHLLQNQILVSNTAPDDETSFTKLRRNYYGIAGCAIPLNENLDFIPSVLVKYLRGGPLQADFNASFLIINLFTLGAAYRTDQALALMVQVNVGKGFSIGYSYDIWFNVLKSYNSGSHEIRIGYELDIFHRDRMLTPRYF